MSPFNVATIDIQTSLLDTDEEILLGSIVQDNNALLVVSKSFLSGDSESIRLIEDAISNLLDNPTTAIGALLTEHKINVKIEHVDNEGDVVKRLIETAHQWRPKVLAFWHLAFDMPKMLSALKKYGYSPAGVFSDPSIHVSNHFFRYEEGASSKTLAGGMNVHLHPAERWHKVLCPAGWVVLDAMCVYWLQHQTKLPSYTFQTALQSQDMPDMTFSLAEPDMTDRKSKIDWIRQLQMNYRGECCANSLFRAIGIRQLEEKTGYIERTVATYPVFSIPETSVNDTPSSTE